MMTQSNISIINVDLGADIDSIINANITEITDKNQRVIDAAIEEVATQQIALAAAQQAKTKTIEARAQKMETIFQELLAASKPSDTSFLSSGRILTIVAPEMPNMISFVGCMRNWLVANNRPYRLASIKRGKESGYRLNNLDAPA